MGTINYRMCNRIRAWGTKISSRIPYRLENHKCNIFRYIGNANNEAILHSYAFMPLRLAFYCHLI